MGLFAGYPVGQCCCFSLETGVTILSALTILNGILQLSGSAGAHGVDWFALMLGIVQVVCGSYGAYSAQKGDSDHLLYFWYFQIVNTLVTVVACVLLLLLFCFLGCQTLRRRMRRGTPSTQMGPGRRGWPSLPGRPF